MTPEVEMQGRSPGGGGDGAPHHPQLWEWVAEQIRTAILEGEIAPGSKLVESELAERFGTSRGPVREALRELAYTGLVVELPRRGTVVSTLDAHDLAEVYAVREALETAAGGVAVGRATDAELARLEPLLDALEQGADYLEAAAHDLEFHRALVALAANARMSAIYEHMLTQTMLLLRSAAQATPTLRSELRPTAHRDILAALRARDAQATRVAIEAHYRYAEDRLFGAIGRPDGTGRRP